MWQRRWHTSKVGSVHQLHADVSFGQDADDSVLDEVHLLADGALSDDVVSRLEDFKSQFGQHGGYKVGISVGKQRHGGDQLPAVKVDDFLNNNRKQLLIRTLYWMFKDCWTCMLQMMTVYVSIQHCSIVQKVHLAFQREQELRLLISWLIREKHMTVGVFWSFFVCLFVFKKGH